MSEWKCINCRTINSSVEVCALCGRPEVLDDLKYLNLIETLAHGLMGAANSDGVLPLEENAGAEPSSFLMALNKLASSLGHYHYDGDGCLEFLGIYDSE